MTTLYGDKVRCNHPGCERVMEDMQHELCADCGNTLCADHVEKASGCRLMRCLSCIAYRGSCDCWMCERENKANAGFDKHHDAKEKR